MAPRYPVDKVIAAATNGDLDLVGSRARDIVQTYVEGFADSFSFASALVAALRLEHFQETVTLGPPYKGEFDVYICPISSELMSRYGLEHVPNWYVKLKLTENDNGDSVLVVSMHPPEKPARQRRKR
ncbi:MAG: hypothetical protein Q8N23_12210 [Archangium sp.]|nr:hypothetical protein [Archangium sp.]MDP3153432.1 hypothetical protein [Archangium sp.]MDP3573410.1 hypothetical protein [Archangium sp.]